MRCCSASRATSTPTRPKFPSDRRCRRWNRHGIVAGGASVKTAQELARHSDPRLTIGRYSHARLHDLQGALDALPSTTPSEPYSQPQAMRATGTEDQTTEVVRGQMRGQYGGKTVRETANCGERHEISAGAESTTEAGKEASPNVLSLRDLATKKPRPARRGEGAEGTGLPSPYAAKYLPYPLCGRKSNPEKDLSNSNL